MDKKTQKLNRYFYLTYENDHFCVDSLNVKLPLGPNEYQNNTAKKMREKLAICNFYFYFFIFRFSAHLGLGFNTLFVQNYSVICRPSNHTVGRPRTEIRTRDGR